MSEIAAHVRKLSLNREVQRALLAEKYYDFDLAAVKHYERREGREEGEEIGKEIGREQGELSTYAKLVSDGTISIQVAAKNLNTTVAKLKEKFKEVLGITL